MRRLARVPAPIVLLLLAASATRAGAIAVPVQACPPLSFFGWGTSVGNPGLNDHVWDLEVAGPDSALGPAVYACGDFTHAGGVLVNHVAKWDGASWSALGTGLTPTSPQDFPCETIAIGPDDRLYAGGSFTAAGGVAAHNIAVWDGTTWSDVSGGLNGRVTRITFSAVNNNTTALYATGDFDSTWGSPTPLFDHIAAWDGTFWGSLTPLANPGTDGTIWSINEFDDGGGSQLYVGGCFDTAGGVAAQNLARWDGSAFSALAGSPAPGGCFAAIDIEPYDGHLHVGGAYTDVPMSGEAFVSRWSGTKWKSVDDGVNRSPEDLHVADVGNGSSIYVAGPHTNSGGGFPVTGGITTNFVSRWSGQWDALGLGLSATGPGGGNVPLGVGAHAMTMDATTDDTIDPGSPDGCLYVAGWFGAADVQPTENIAKWCCLHTFGGQRLVSVHALDGVIFTIFDHDGDGLPEGLRCADDGPPVALPHGQVTAACDGLCVVLGTAGNDVLGPGGAGCARSVVFGGPGHDSLTGSDRADLLFGGAGDDVIAGGDGDDEIHGDAGADDLAGGDGDDALGGGAGADTLDGGPGDDVLAGHDDADTLDGGPGVDRVDGGGQAGDGRAGAEEILDVPGCRQVAWTDPPLAVPDQNPRGAVVALRKLDKPPGEHGLDAKGVFNPAPGGPPVDPGLHGARLRVQDSRGVLLALNVPGGPRAGAAPPSDHCGPADGWLVSGAAGGPRTWKYANVSGALPPACEPGSARGLQAITVADLRATAKQAITYGLKLRRGTIAAPPVTPMSLVRFELALGAQPDADTPSPAATAGQCVAAVFQADRTGTIPAAGRPACKAGAKHGVVKTLKCKGA